MLRSEPHYSRIEVVNLSISQRKIVKDFERIDYQTP
jgi:hypothetical protein